MIYVIIVVTFIILFFGGLIGSYIYKKVKGLPTGECASCAGKMKKAVRKAKKDLHSKSDCTCGCHNE